jgi:hypothetical protein
MSRLPRQCGILNISLPCRSPLPVTGIALLTYLCLQNSFLFIVPCQTMSIRERAFSFEDVGEQAEAQWKRIIIVRVNVTSRATCKWQCVLTAYKMTASLSDADCSETAKLHGHIPREELTYRDNLIPGMTLWKQNCLPVYYRLLLPSKHSPSEAMHYVRRWFHGRKQSWNRLSEYLAVKLSLVLDVGNVSKSLSRQGVFFLNFVIAKNRRGLSQVNKVD